MPGIVTPARLPRCRCASDSVRDEPPKRRKPARFARQQIIAKGVPAARYFTPLAALTEVPPYPQPALDALEAFLLQLFLRRYITYCARRRKFAAMNGAARLYANLRTGA